MGANFEHGGLVSGGLRYSPCLLSSHHLPQDPPSKLKNNVIWLLVAGARYDALRSL